MSLPRSAVSDVNCEPVSCMPSPESPAKRTITWESCSTGLLLTGLRTGIENRPTRHEETKATELPRRTRSWTPKAIPFGALILLLGLWAIFAPLVGGYFGFGFYSDATW